MRMADAAPRPGDVIAGRFELVQPARARSSSILFEAMDVAKRTRVAVEVFAVGDTVTRAAEALRSVDHPRVVRWIADGIDERGRPWLATEWVDGELLSARIARGPLDVAEAIEIAQGIAGALATLHRARIAHGDVTADNVVLELGKGARLRAPRAGAAQMDTTEDVRALGALLFATLTGRAPTSIAEEACAVRRGIPAPLDALLLAMRADDPARRPASVVAVVHALADILGQIRLAPSASSARTEASTSGGDESSGATFARATAAHASGTVDAKAQTKRGRTRWIAVGLGAVAAGGALAAAFVIARRSPDPSASSASVQPQSSAAPQAACAAGECVDAAFPDPKAVDLADVIAALDPVAQGHDAALERIGFTATCVAGGRADVSSAGCAAAASYARRDGSGHVVAYVSVSVAAARIAVIALDPTTAPKDLFARTAPTCRSTDAARAAARFAPTAAWSGVVSESEYAKPGGPATWQFGRTGDLPIGIDGTTCAVVLDASKPAPPPVQLPFAVGERVLLVNDTSTALTGVVLEFKGGTREIGTIPGHASIDAHVPRFPLNVKYAVGGARKEAPFELGSAFDASNGEVEIHITATEPRWNLKAQSTSHVKGDAATCSTFRACCVFPSLRALEPDDPVNAACRAAEETGTDCTRALESVKRARAAASRAPSADCP